MELLGIDQYRCRTEFQSRGASHFHGLASFLNLARDISARRKVGAATASVNTSSGSSSCPPSCLTVRSYCDPGASNWLYCKMLIYVTNANHPKIFKKPRTLANPDEMNERLESRIVFVDMLPYFSFGCAFNLVESTQ